MVPLASVREALPSFIHQILELFAQTGHLQSRRLAEHHLAYPSAQHLSQLDYGACCRPDVKDHELVHHHRGVETDEQLVRTLEFAVGKQLGTQSASGVEREPVIRPEARIDDRVHRDKVG